MSFNEVKLKWNDVEYVVPHDRVLGAIARVEDIITLEELSRYMLKETAPRARLAMAFGSMLRYAGALVTDDEIYEGMFGTDKNRIQGVVEATTALLAMMLPPSASGDGAGGVNPPLPLKKARRNS